MRTRDEKNGVVKKAIVLQWAVRIASRDFKPGKKRWAGALLSEEEEEEEKHFWPSGDFLVRYFRDAVVRHENTRRWTVGCYYGL